MIRLGVNIDHIASIRNLRKGDFPDPVYAAEIVEDAGADSITVHLREDRRHINEKDVISSPDVESIYEVPLNFEEAWDLADLEGRKHDLEWVKEVSQKYLQCFDKISDFIIHDVFCSAIIVRYGRAHNKGRKKIMPAECFKGLTQEEKDKHNFY